MKNAQKQAMRLWAGIVKTRDRCCQHCGVGGDLEAHHLFLRSLTNWMVQYDPDYGIALCFPCHQIATAEPARFRDKIIARLLLIPAERDWMSEFYKMMWYKHWQQDDGMCPEPSTRAEKIIVWGHSESGVQIYRPDWQFIRAVLRAELACVTLWSEDNADCEPGYGRTL